MNEVTNSQELCVLGRLNIPGELRVGGGRGRDYLSGTTRHKSNIF